MKKIIKHILAALPFKKQIFTFIRAVYLPGEKIYRHLYFKGEFKVSVSKNASFKMKHYGYQLENDIFWNGLFGRWEKISMQAWVNLSKTSMIVFDIGANTGIYSLVSKTVNPEAKVLAFDPVKRVFHKLQENLRINNFNVACYNVGVSDHIGKAVFYDTDSEHTYTVVINKDLSNDPQYHPVEVDLITIDEIINQEKLERVDLIKIDVESHEPEVLRGFSQIMKFQPSILVEVLSEKVGNEIEEILKQYGCQYIYFDIDEEKGMKQVDHIGKGAGYNYLLCTKEVADRLFNK